MSPPSADNVTTSDAVARVALQGELHLRSGKALWNTLKQAEREHARQVEVDLSDVTAADGSAAAILTSYRAELRSKGVDCQLIGARENVAEILRLYENTQKLGPRPRRKAQGQLDQIGTAAIAVALEAQMVIAFFGQMVVGMMNAFRAPRSVNWKELLPTAERAGADAVPIVALINFLVGMVISLQSAAQLHRFGADIYMADLIGISVVREIGPLPDERPRHESRRVGPRVAPRGQEQMMKCVRCDDRADLTERVDLAAQVVVERTRRDHEEAAARQRRDRRPRGHRHAKEGHRAERGPEPRRDRRQRHG